MSLIKDLDGNTHQWHLTGNMSKGRTSNRSSLHLQARELITNKYPTLQILEEVPIQLRRSEVLYLDFYLPLTKTCIEVHGEQHYKFVPFYHNNMLGFLKAQKRDKEKTEWCEINMIKQIILPYNENIEEWNKRLSDE
ncbi:hypothetical protein EB118_21370 [bacterium]|nr:hypothetical protein [bacterium]NDG32609.1 hypothetical protein [bacterium]